MLETKLHAIGHSVHLDILTNGPAPLDRGYLTTENTTNLDQMTRRRGAKRTHLVKSSKP